VIQSLFFRDVFHILALYVQYLQSVRAQPASAPASEATEPVPFSEWLFELPQEKP
jgi:hypothetical protein